MYFADYLRRGQFDQFNMPLISVLVLGVIFSIVCKEITWARLSPALTRWSERIVVQTLAAGESTTGALSNAHKISQIAREWLTSGHLEYFHTIFWYSIHIHRAIN